MYGIQVQVYSRIGNGSHSRHSQVSGVTNRAIGIHKCPNLIARNTLINRGELESSDHTGDHTSYALLAIFNVCQSWPGCNTGHKYRRDKGIITFLSDTILYNSKLNSW